MAKYLYNGVELPELPEWDKTTYPYACIATFGDYYELYVSNVPMYFEYENVGPLFTNYIRIKDEGTILLWTRYTDTPDIWTDRGESEYNYCFAGILIWCNFDCYNYADDTLRLAASDPVPVEPEQPETDLTNIDLYRKINGKLVKRTLYKKVDGKLVKYDEYAMLMKAQEQGEIVGYLYNGVQLPDINEVWTDKVTYPYAFIERKALDTNDDGTGEFVGYFCQLYLYTVAPIVKIATDGKDGIYLPKGASMFIATCCDEGVAEFMASMGVTTAANVWVKDREYELEGDNYDTGAYSLLWTSHDIIRVSDGSVYLAASDPVPVGGEIILTERDLYRKIDGKPTKLTLYKKLGGKLIPLDEYTKEVKT